MGNGDKGRRRSRRFIRLLGGGWRRFTWSVEKRNEKKKKTTLCVILMKDG
jgi:hypothetical protein